MELLFCLAVKLCQIKWNKAGRQRRLVVGSVGIGRERDQHGRGENQLASNSVIFAVSLFL